MVLRDSRLCLAVYLNYVVKSLSSPGKCKICELTFANEAAFLQHMKYTHRPGEMPYACQASPEPAPPSPSGHWWLLTCGCVLQVCDFRSSFYSELWFHFEQFHANTKHFLCRYCLRVLHSSTCYQQHFSLHQVSHLHTHLLSRACP